MQGPLDGVKVIDLSSVVLGPFATQILADLGADVVKVESFEGDTLRYIGPSRSKGMGPNYLALNRSKRSIALDLRRKEGIDVLKRLIAGADVFLSNLRPASMARLGLGYDQVAHLNARIIYCGTYGFGEGGRYAGKPAFDDLIQGAVALPHLVERVTGKPTFLPTNICDRTTGLTAVYSVVAALYSRERTGRGQSIEVPMMETMTQFVMSDHMFGHIFDPPIGDAGYSRLLTKGRGPFRTRDGYICALIYLDKHWRKFCDIVARPDLVTDARFASVQARSMNIDALTACVAELLSQRTTADWMEICTKADIPVMPMHTPDSLMEDPHLQDVGFFTWIDHPSEGRIRSMAVPTTFSDTPAGVPRHAPLLGENSREILSEVGYSETEITGLLEARAVRVAVASAPGTPVNQGNSPT